MSEDERRKHTRRLVCIVANVDARSRPQHNALISDLSESGAFFLTRLPLEPGERVDLTLVVGETKEARTLAEVVRVEVLEPERATVWKRGVAVRFDQPLTELTQAIEAEAEVLRRAQED